MNNSRRHFLKTGSIVALAATIPTQLDKAVGQGRRAITQDRAGNNLIPLQSQRDSLLYLRRSYFQPYLNSRFEVQTATRVVPVILASIDELGSMKAAKSRMTTEKAGELDSFSLIFRGSTKASLKQDVYNIQHPALGEFRVLVVPVASKDTGARYYEVIFNRSHE